MENLSFFGFIAIVFWSMAGAVSFFNSLDELPKTKQRVVAGILCGPIVWLFCGAFLLGSAWMRVADLVLNLIKKL